MRPVRLIACAATALALGACKPKPEGGEVASAMPDTNAPRAPDVNMTAPDAGATGAVEPVPAPNPDASTERQTK